MRAGHDLLYTLFEQHLFNALVENESSEEFLVRVVDEYVMLLSSKGMITSEHRTLIKEDLKEEVLEMLRKKTYGHYNLAEFRKSIQDSGLGPKSPGPNRRSRLSN